MDISAEQQDLVCDGALRHRPIRLPYAVANVVLTQTWSSHPFVFICVSAPSEDCSSFYTEGMRCGSEAAAARPHPFIRAFLMFTNHHVTHLTHLTTMVKVGCASAPECHRLICQAYMNEPGSRSRGRIYNPP